MSKTSKTEPSDDLVRETILKYLYDALKSSRGINSHKLQITKIYSELKKRG